MRRSFTKIKILLYLSLFIQLISSSCLAEEYPPKIKVNLTQTQNIETTKIENIFQQQLNSNNVIYTRVPRGLIISLPSNLFFENGKDILLENSKPVINLISTILNTQSYKCMIEANTEPDSWTSSKFAYNWELATSRADNIVNYMIKFQKVNPQKIRAIGFGEMEPFYDKTKGFNFMNERIDFIIINYEKTKPLD